jgi:hypothetical protein
MSLGGVIYNGQRNDLRGRTAVIRVGDAGRALAQFDPPAGIRIEHCIDPLCFGWHDFAWSDFVRPIGKQRARKLRRRGENVWWDIKLGAYVWIRRR